MKNFSLAAGVLLVAAPLMAVLPGCGGSSSGGLFPTSTPVATATVTATSLTPTPTGTATGQLSSTFELSSGQIAQLNVIINGSRITGTLVVPNDASAAFKVRQANIAIPKGSYNVTGTFTPTRSYSLTGTTAEGPFTLSGLLPTTTQTGTYSLTYFGRTDSGTIPALQSTNPTPTATVRPTATSTLQPTATATVRATATTRPTATSRPTATATTRATATARPTSTTQPTAFPTAVPTPTAPPRD